MIAGMMLATDMAVASTHTGTVPDKGSKVKNPERHGYIYRIMLKDKKGTPFSIDRPREFLSRKSIERRKRQNLAVDSTDLPVNPKYLQMLNIDNVNIVGVSRWHNSVLVYTTDTANIVPLEMMECVAGRELVWQAPDSILPTDKKQGFHDRFNSWDTIRTSHYGATNEQIAVLNGQSLHRAGFNGRGITIAVLDGGFRNADRIPVISDIRIAGTHDFIYPKSKSIYRETEHGTKVLSAMGVNAPNVYVGTAPGATYWLLRCEDSQTEQPVEEDYWTMAAEFADSVGVDMINSSVGYNEFDNHDGDHKYHEMDGHTTFVSQSASMLADKGIVLVCSAGNSGMGPWKKIAFPADADDILTVGALTPQLTNAPFSGVGPTQDGRIKPDVMAPGSPASVISGRGTVVQDMGTSFATPIVCGLVACLWQSRPELTARKIIDIVRRSGDNYKHPDNIYGYGIPDFKKAMDDGKNNGPGITR